MKLLFLGLLVSLSSSANASQYSLSCVSEAGEKIKITGLNSETGTRPKYPPSWDNSSYIRATELEYRAQSTVTNWIDRKNGKTISFAGNANVSVIREQRQKFESYEDYPLSKYAYVAPELNISVRSPDSYEPVSFSIYLCGGEQWAYHRIAGKGSYSYGGGGEFDDSAYWVNVQCSVDGTTIEELSKSLGVFCDRSRWQKIPVTPAIESLPTSGLDSWTKTIQHPGAKAIRAHVSKVQLKWSYFNRYPSIKTKNGKGEVLEHWTPELADSESGYSVAFNNDIVSAPSLGDTVTIDLNGSESGVTIDYYEIWK
jgi:hypothetical protein